MILIDVSQDGAASLAEKFENENITSREDFLLFAALPCDQMEAQLKAMGIDKLGDRLWITNILFELRKDS
jgi:hypothetical protein